MKWGLSNGHVASWFINPPSLVAAAHEREHMRVMYRALMVGSRRTTDLGERAALQASAAVLRRALLASGGFDGAALVLIVEGDETHTYDDGESAPLHCTIKYLGPAADLSTIDKHRVISTAQRIGNAVGPFTAGINAEAGFGPDGNTPVKIIEADELNTVRDLALDDATVRHYGELNDEHPQWIPHIAGLDDRDDVRFDRVGAFLGGTNHIYDLTGTQTLDKDPDSEIPQEMTQ